HCKNLHLKNGPMSAGIHPLLHNCQLDNKCCIGLSSRQEHRVRNSPTAVEQRFAEARLRLGPHRQELIRAMVDRCEETCFLSSREVGRLYGVNAATVVRTVQAMGYSGFADFTNDLRQHLMARMTPYTALKAATREKRSIADH